MTRRPHEILDEIDRTRGEMAGTLGAIKQRLAPAQVKAEGRRYLRTHGPGKYVTRARHYAREKPFTVAMVGIALAFLFVLRLARSDD
jgi:hypothetical protein